MCKFSIYQLCKKHHFGIDKPEKLAQSPDDSKFLMKTFSQIKSNVAVPIKKKVCLPSIYYTQVDTLPNALSLLYLIPSASFRVSRFFLLPWFFLLCSPTQSSVPLPSRSRRTRRKNASRGGSSMSCTKYSWTRTLSTIA